MHDHPQSPYFEIIGTYLSLTFSFFSFTLFLSPFAFLSYFHCFLHVSCFGSLSFVSHLSYFLFPNIFEYLYTPVLVVCSSFEIISSTSPLDSHFRFQLKSSQHSVIAFAIVQHTVCTRNIRIICRPNIRIVRIVPPNILILPIFLRTHSYTLGVVSTLHYPTLRSQENLVLHFQSLSLLR
jgi:hypothetical protein